MEKFNIPEANIVAIIESSFKEGAMPYFQVVLDKATDYMTLTAQSKKEIRNAIGESGYIDLSNKINTNSVTAGAKLEANSIDITPMGTVGYDYEKEKENFKKRYSFRR